MGIPINTYVMSYAISPASQSTVLDHIYLLFKQLKCLVEAICGVSFPLSVFWKMIAALSCLQMPVSSLQL